MKLLIALIGELARRRHVELPPDWAKPLAALDPTSGNDPDALALLCTTLGWTSPARLRKSPRAQQFPVLVHHPLKGWALADQWQNENTVRALTGTSVEFWSLNEAALSFFQPTLPGEVAGETPSRAFAIFRRALLSRKRMLGEAIVATAVVSVLGLGVSLFTMQVYDRVIPQGGLSTLWVLLVGVLIATGLEFLLRWLRAVALEREAAQIDAEVSEIFFSRMQALRLDTRPGSVGTLAAQMRGMEQIRSVMSAASIFFVADLPFAFFLVWVTYVIGGSLALIPLFGLPVVVLMAWGFARAIKRETKRTQIGNYRKNGLLVEAISASETVKAARGNWDLLARWNGLVEDINRDDERVRRLTALSQSAAASIQQVVYLSMIAWGSLSVISGDITMGALIACSIIAGRINGPLMSQLPAIILQWSYARTALEGLDSLLALPVDREPGNEYLRPTALSGDLHLSATKFSYPNAQSGIEAENLRIGPGERVAVIGPIGTGKSTLLKILAGLFKPQAGSVLLGGLDMHQIAEDTLRSHVGYLSQDYRLIQGTLRQNLLLGLPDPGDDVIMAAAAQTGLAPFIASQAKGLDLPISEGGTGLSGGQRQLVGLTRLLLAKPKVWLLDEPTASLDHESEARVLAALDRTAGPQDTIVLVTHKPALLQLARRIVVVAGGKVVMDGPAAQVIERLRQSNVVKGPGPQQETPRAQAS